LAADGEPDDRFVEIRRSDHGLFAVDGGAPGVTVVCGARTERPAATKAGTEWAFRAITVRWFRAITVRWFRAITVRWFRAITVRWSCG
jgi:hypothetical protein